MANSLSNQDMLPNDLVKSINDLVASELGGTRYAGDAAANTTVTDMVIAGPLPTAATIMGWKITPEAAVTASNSTFATIAVKKADGTGNNSVAMATVLTANNNNGTGNLTALKTLDMGAITGAACPAGTIFTMTTTKNSTGTQLPAFMVSPIFG